jgi:hypothetical protein
MSSREARLSRAEGLRQERNFNVLCGALQRNDPTVTKVEATKCAYPVGYGRRLGAALQGNERVTSCELNLSTIMSSVETIGNDLDLLLEYLATGKKLREVSLKDGSGDPTVSHTC